MLKIKLLTPLVGNTLKDGKFAGHFAYSRGDEIEWPAPEAKRFIERGYAVPVNEKKN